MRARAAMVVAAMSTGCIHGAAAPPPATGEIVVHGDSPGNAARPAEVQIVVRKGALRLRPGSRGGHLVEGSVRGRDSTLLPHVTVNARGVAVVQDFTPDDGIAAKMAWDLSLGETPMRLFVHVVGSEEQHVDLGGRPIVTARLFNEGGHLDADWSAPNPRAAERIELWSIGYLEVRHLARSRAKRIEVKNVGLAEIDLGDRVDADLRLDVESTAGTLVLTVPVGVTARATLDVPPIVRVEAEGWDHEPQGAYTLGPLGPTPRVTIAARANAGLIRLRTSRSTR